jgi:hypothetical protein
MSVDVLPFLLMVRSAARWPSPHDIGLRRVAVAHVRDVAQIRRRRR